VTSEQDKRVEELFDELVSLPVEARDQALSQQCPDDAEVREEVARLLSSAEREASTANPFFPDLSPTRGIFPDVPATDSIEIGSSARYRILEKVGSGGFGTVFKAEQRHPVHRIVALKIIKPGYDTQEVIARFNAERQALAMMDHPNIAKVLDAGATVVGRPYFAMEYVAGRSITRFSDENKLTVKERLLLFREVCDAITHAHQKAIIHRDIKASNVLGFMRDGKPHVKVIDFGIAKALSGDRLTEMTFNTQQGVALGTYESMSPEQAAGSPDIDTRSDVYSLGVLLYHLLSGIPPIDRKKLAEMDQTEIRRTICDGETPSPTAQLRALGKEASSLASSRQCDAENLVRQLNRELEWIPLKAMRKERERRYDSPQQLSDDIQNYLEGRRLIAGPESRLYRARKFFQQNANLVATIAGIVIVLLMGVVATTHEAIKAVRAERASHISELKALDAARAEARSRDDAKALAGKNLRLADQAKAAADKAKRELGLAFLERARHLNEENDDFSAAMTAESSIGFASDAGGGGATGGEPLLDPASRDGQEAWGLSVLSATPRLIWRTPAGTHHDGPVRSVAISFDGKLLASGSNDQTVRVWDLTHGGRILQNINIHSGAVQSVSFNSDASQLAVAFASSIGVWDVATGEQLRRLNRHTATVRSVVFSSDGNLIATASDDHTIRIWDMTAPGAPMSLLGHSDAVLSVCFSPDAKWLVSGSRDHTIRIWGAASGMPAHVWAMRDSVNCVSVSADGKTIASACKDGTVCLWDLKGKLVRKMDGEFGEMTSVRFSPDGTMLAAGSVDRALRIWDARSGALLQSVVQHAGPVYSLCFTPDGQTVATGASDSRIGLWNIGKGQSQQVELPAHKDIATGLGFSPDGNILAAASGDCRICLWDARTGQFLRMLDEKDHAPAPGATRFMKIAFSPDGRFLASQASDDQTTTLWSLTSSSPVWVRRGRTVAPIELSMPACVSFSPDGKTLACSGDENAVQILDVAGGDVLAELQGHSAPVQCVSFSPDGKMLASGAFDGSARLWNTKSLAPASPPLGRTRAVYSVSFSPDGSTLAAGSLDGTVRLWDVASAKETRALRGRMVRVYSVCFSPDGRTIASGSYDNTIRLWDLRDTTDTEPLTIIHGSTDCFSSVCFSPDGRTLAAACWDSTVSLWDVAQDRPMPSLLGHKEGVISLCFSPDGKMMASGSNDMTARVWDLASAQTTQCLKQEDHVNSICFSPDGTELITGCDSKPTGHNDNLLKLWNVRDGTLTRKFPIEQGILSTSFQPDGQMIAAGTRTGAIWFWNHDGSLVRTVQSDSTGVDNDGVYAMSFSPDGRSLVSGSRNGAVIQWDVTSGRVIRTFGGHRDRVTAIVFSPDGGTIVSSSYDGAICFWDAHSGELKWTSNQSPSEDNLDGIVSLRLSPDGRLLASGNRWDGSIRIWDVARRVQLQTIQAIRTGIGGVFGLCFSPDGSTLAAGTDNNTIGFWAIQPNIPLRQYLEIYKFDGLELKPLPPSNLFGDAGFLARTQQAETENPTSGIQGKVK
jgi:WD40 repeat protein/serine/threonine protein kinase